MVATPANIAKFTTDGVLLTVEDATIKQNQIDATDAGEREISFLFESAADGEAMLAEKFEILSKISPLHEAVEVSEDLGLGTRIAIAPVVPCYIIIDDTRQIDKLVRTRAFAYDMGSDRYSVEVLE